jgi:diaminopimelate epimerase
MSAVFHKATGSGNDFVMFDGRTTSDADWPAERIVRICDRRDGIGGDGLVIVTPLGDNAVRMTFFNADGSRAAMCGNAALCTTRFAAAMEMADPAGMTLVTDAGSFGARCVGSEGGALAELHLPDAPVPVPASVELGEGEQSISLGTVGVPHLVTVVDEVAAVDVAERGRIQRFHPGCGAGGANANFVSRISPSSGTGGAADPAAPTWALRTYERGVEGETLACGTGTVAAALVLATAGLDQLPLRFRSASGRVLTVNAQISDGVAHDIWLCGEGRLVARGVWLG